MFAAIKTFVTITAPLLTKLVELLVTFIEFFQNYYALKRQRLKDQIDSEIEAKMRAKEEQYKKEMANVKAFKAIEENAWKIRHAQILKFLKADKPESVIKLVHEIDRPDVNEFLFDSTLGNEYKALKIVNIMKNNIKKN